MSKVHATPDIATFDRFFPLSGLRRGISICANFSRAAFYFIIRFFKISDPPLIVNEPFTVV